MQRLSQTILTIRFNSAGNYNKTTQMHVSLTVSQHLETHTKNCKNIRRKDTTTTLTYHCLLQLQKTALIFLFLYLSCNYLAYHLPYIVMLSHLLSLNMVYNSVIIIVCFFFGPPVCVLLYIHRSSLICTFQCFSPQYKLSFVITYQLQGMSECNCINHKKEQHNQKFFHGSRLWKCNSVYMYILVPASKQLITIFFSSCSFSSHRWRHSEEILRQVWGEVFPDLREGAPENQHILFRYLFTSGILMIDADYMRTNSH